MENINNIIEMIRKHEEKSLHAINLIASENQLSYLAKDALLSDLGNRVAEGWISERLFPGINYYNEIEMLGMNLIRSMFKADFVDLRPISGTMANMVVFSAFTKPNDKILAIAVKDGGHISMSGATPRKVFGLQIINIPMIENKINEIDVDKTIAKIYEEVPRLVILGGSVIIQKLDIKRICVAAHEVNSIVIFDASHVAGLIVGGVYENPFDVGVDIITTSTCKTIPGPQHGMILSKKQYEKNIKMTTFPSLHSGHHLHHVLSTIITMYEMQEFGKNYAEQILNNSQKLAEILMQKGIAVYQYDKDKYTDTHMFMILDDNAQEIVNKLESVNIISNCNVLPWDKNFRNGTGIRMGTPEITRIGMCEGDMHTVADFIVNAILETKDRNELSKEIREFVGSFKKIKYCYDKRIWGE